MIRTGLITALLLSVASAAPAATTGPYPARIEADPNLRYHTVYRPVDLDKIGPTKLPLVVFAGGGCRNAGGRFRNFLTEVASHGYLVLALGEIGDPDFDSNPDNDPDYKGRPTKTDVSQISYAIKWAKAENERAGSRYKGKLDTSRIALMGQSCGGVQSIDVATREPGLSTLVVLNSGTFPDDRELGGSEVKQTDLPKIAIPTLILVGGKEDVAYENGQRDFDRMINAAAFVASADYGHRATYFQENGGLFGRVAIDWLNWVLRGDGKAAARFVGTDCGLCRDQEWTVRSRGLERVATARK